MKKARRPSREQLITAIAAAQLDRAVGASCNSKGGAYYGKRSHDDLTPVDDVVTAPIRR